MNDHFSGKKRRKLNEGKLEFEIYDNGILVQTENKGVEIVASNSLKNGILHIKHDSILAGHLGAANSTIQYANIYTA